MGLEDSVKDLYTVSTCIMYYLFNIQTINMKFRTENKTKNSFIHPKDTVNEDQKKNEMKAKPMEF